VVHRLGDTDNTMGDHRVCDVEVTSHKLGDIGSMTGDHQVERCLTRLMCAGTPGPCLTRAGTLVPRRAWRQSPGYLQHKKSKMGPSKEL
jgi:hypothetical protein